MNENTTRRYHTLSDIIVTVVMLALAAWFLAIAFLRPVQADPGPAAAQGASANYRIAADALNPGGGPSSSATYRIVNVIGQPADGGAASSAGFRIQSGLLPALGQAGGASESYSLLADPFSLGGGPSSSANFRLDDTIGQASDGGEATDGSFRLYSGAAYTLGSLPDHNDRCQDAGALTAGGVYTSYLSTASDVDYYKVYVAAPYATLHLRLYHPTQDYDVMLYYDCTESGGWARNIGWAHNIGEQTASFNVGTQTGWYYVAVSGRDGRLHAGNPLHAGSDPDPRHHGRAERDVCQRLRDHAGHALRRVYRQRGGRGLLQGVRRHALQ